VILAQKHSHVATSIAGERKGEGHDSHVVVLHQQAVGWLQGSIYLTDVVSLFLASSLLFLARLF
jgi:hypothetical protein